jgi:AcrR family transcriptional regulator
MGPARTTVAQIADRAGVQRHTYYAHFPDERSLMLACSGLALERDPLPKVDEWQTVPSGAPRICRGLEELYAWYERNERLTVCVLRDAEFHEPTREAAELRMGPIFERARNVLGADLSERARALLGVALQFATWRELSASLAPHSAAGLMADAICGLEKSSGNEDSLRRPRPHSRPGSARRP